MTNLDAGDYWLKETSVGTANEANGFKAGMVVAVTIEAGQNHPVLRSRRPEHGENRAF